MPVSNLRSSDVAITRRRGVNGVAGGPEDYCLTDLCQIVGGVPLLCVTRYVNTWAFHSVGISDIPTVPFYEHPERLSEPVVTDKVGGDVSGYAVDFSGC